MIRLEALAVVALLAIGCGGSPISPSTSQSPQPATVRTAEPPASEGAFDVRLVVRMIQTRQADIRTCYERALRTDRTLAGSLRVTLTILESGMMGDVHTSENTMGTEAVAECIVGVIRGFRFTPGPEGGSVTFQFPFVFEPQDAPR